MEPSGFRQLVLNKKLIIDVRAPVEFAEGSIPGSVNLPILDDEDRRLVGTLYKQEGQEAAIRKGQELVSGAVKEARIERWKACLRQNPDAVITCFRGGLRSKIAQEWLQQEALPRPRLKGGYKAFRQFLRTEMDRLSQHKLRVISGPTGSGKTQVLRQLQAQKPILDLEALACHRGSAFGAYSQPQPTQIDFENRLSVEMLRNEQAFAKGLTLVEDESRMIGRCVQPEKLFLQLRDSEIIFIDESLADRVEEILQEYILRLSPAEQQLAFLRYETGLQKISSKLGGLRYQELCQDLRQAMKKSQEENDFNTHRTWIEKLLVWYYDPIYTRSLELRKPRIVFRGTRAAVIQALLTSE